MRKIRMGMIGGGEGAFIGAIHRIAAAIDGQIELVCGCFSSNSEQSVQFGKTLFLSEQRCYRDYHEMMSAEAALPADQRMDFVAIVTPNFLHFKVAMAAINNGFHVLSDKPATMNVEEAKRLREALSASGLLYALTHTYTGYPMVQEARCRVASGELGKIRRVVVEYHQGWLAQATVPGENKQADWRTDPSRAGISCAMGDIGVHAFNLAETIACQPVTELCADLSSIVSGRELDDDGNVLLRFRDGARGVLMASQIAVGEENALRIRIYGEHKALEWSQEEPNTLWLKSNHHPAQQLRTGWAGVGEGLDNLTRTPAGHPEGYLEAFANLYCQFANRILEDQNNIEDDVAVVWQPFDSGDGSDGSGSTDSNSADIPGIDEGIRGMAFIETVVAASASEVKWHRLIV